jgi:hypothetical protein
MATALENNDDRHRREGSSRQVMGFGTSTGQKLLQRSIQIMVRIMVPMAILVQIQDGNLVAIPVTIRNHRKMLVEMLVKTVTITKGANMRIKSPAKFEGEEHYVPYLWEQALDENQEDENGCLILVIEQQDNDKYPELEVGAKYRLSGSDQGFVYCQKVKGPGREPSGRKEREEGRGAANEGAPK